MKSLLWYGVVFSTFCTVIFWVMDPPNAQLWTLRIASLGMTTLLVGSMVRSKFRRDLVPDYLLQYAGTYFHREGVAIDLQVEVDRADGLAWLRILYQNQRDEPCNVQIALRPVRKSFRRRHPLLLECRWHCHAAAFGATRLAVGIPQDLQGQRLEFELGISTEYVNGRGRRVRFREGIAVPVNAEFRRPMALLVRLTEWGFTVFAGIFAVLALRPQIAIIELPLPRDVATEMPMPPRQVTKTLWQLGDAPLQ